MNIPSQSWLSPKVSVENSSIDHLGLFAHQVIHKDEVVEILGGTTLSNKEVDEKIKSSERYDGIALDENVNLTLEQKDWPGIYGNHSCGPNLWMKDAVTVIARRDIQRGEEITIDYAMFTVSPDWSMECNCGSMLCRRVVTGNDWKLRELQERYKGHFAPIVEQLIEN